MAHPFKLEIRQLKQTEQEFQVRMETLITNFVVHDFDGVKRDIDSLYHLCRLLDITLLCILNSSNLLGCVYLKRQNQCQVNSISRSCAAINHLQVKLRLFHEGTAEELICVSSVCMLAVLWHRFVRSLKQAITDLETRPAKRKKNLWCHAMMNA
jgi:hypothetical protein